MLSYRDIENKNLGEQVRVQEENKMQMEETIAQQEVANQREMDAMANDGEVQAVNSANQVIAQMEQLEAKGEDPIKYLESLDPAIQSEVIKILEVNQGGIAQADAMRE